MFCSGSKECYLLLDVDSGWWWSSGVSDGTARKRGHLSSFFGAAARRNAHHVCEASHHPTIVRSAIVHRHHLPPITKGILSAPAAIYFYPKYLPISGRTSTSTRQDGLSSFSSFFSSLFFSSPSSKRKQSSHKASLRTKTRSSILLSFLGL
ncbi:hypothetical protein ASPWEDRAFT_351979 [Aspergillus wentii DTO 134E9]|uniref:Uncharacterized protein n=1 Tax=Aspergillus wentii DTO 134E9 TaxID=1073089 RepID=A0A1L9RVP3_ASPWE|nr:uncharacterized protein ASPWEDRAFT_351979 [Aspergillus wentii DTO 134E9]OJJ39010.1 hypothetical protein ASPWEDRAFT_351979 [Aspergillus wentii DTO 134E9]